MRWSCVAAAILDSWCRVSCSAMKRSERDGLMTTWTGYVLAPCPDAESPGPSELGDEVNGSEAICRAQD